MRRRIMIISTIVLLALGGRVLAACSTTQPEPVVKTVMVEVPVDRPDCARAAIKRLGPSIAYPDTDKALLQASNLFERVKLLLAGRTLRTAREGHLEGALQTCADMPSPVQPP